MTIFVNWEYLFTQTLMEKGEVVEELNSLKANYEADMKAGLDEIGKLRAAYNVSQRTINNLKLDIEALREKNQDLSNGWTREIRLRQEDRQERGGVTYTDLKEQNAALQQALRERQTDLNIAHQQLKMFKPVTEYEQYKEIGAQLLAAQEEITKLQVKNVSLNKFKELYEEIKPQLDYYRKDSDEVREAYVKQQNNLVSYAVEVDMLKKEKKNLSDQLDQAGKDLTALSENLDSMTNMRNHFREDAQRFHDSYEDAKKELHRLRDLNCQLEAELRRTQNYYNSTNLFKMDEIDKEELQKQIKNMTENFDRMTKSRDYYREEYNALATRLNHVSEFIEAAQEAIG